LTPWLQKPERISTKFRL